MAKQTFTTGQVLTAAQMTSLQQTAMGGGSTTAKTASYTLVAADAGTVVQMNSASATTITVNTGLFAAGDSVQIQNIGAGVCTVTAGTATVSTAGSLALSQYEGGQLYFNSASAAIFFDLVQASAASGALTLISTTTFSAQTSQSFNNVFSSTYDNYKILMTTYGSADQNMTWKFRASGTDNSSANYYYAIWGASAASGALASDNNGTGATSMIFAGNNNTAQRQLISMDVMSPMSTSSTKGILYNFVRSRTGIFGGNGWGLLDVAGTAFDGFTITPNSGNTTGTVSIYGWSK